MLITVKVKAVSAQKIEYKKQGKIVVVPKGTEIAVDQERNIALINGDHVQVFEKDYKILFPH